MNGGQSASEHLAAVAKQHEAVRALRLQRLDKSAKHVADICGHGGSGGGFEVDAHARSY